MLRVKPRVPKYKSVCVCVCVREREMGARAVLRVKPCVPKYKGVCVCVCVCVREREMGARAVLRVKASCPKPGSRQKTPVRGGGGAAKEARGRRAGSAQETFA